MNDSPNEEFYKKSVDRLLHRLRDDKNVTCDDQIDILEGLRALATDCRNHMASNGMALFVEILKKDVNKYGVSIGLTLDILNSLLTNRKQASAPLSLTLILVEEDEEKGACNASAEIMLNILDFMPTLLRILACQDPNIQKSALKLFASLLLYQRGALQLLLFSHGMSTNIFGVLFDVIDKQPLDAIFLEHSINLIFLLLVDNELTQYGFQQNGFIQRLAKLAKSFVNPASSDLQYGLTDHYWNSQKIKNFVSVLKITQLLASSRANHNFVARKEMQQSGMLHLVCRLSQCQIALPPTLLPESLITLAEILRGHCSNPEIFVGIDLTNLARSLIQTTMYDNIPPLDLNLRMAAHHCFDGYLHGNKQAQRDLVDVFLPRNNSARFDPVDATAMIGERIHDGFLSGSPSTNWFACAIFIHIFLEGNFNYLLTEENLTIYTGEGSTPLMAHLGSLLCNIVQRDVPTRCGVLMLLSVWLHHCESAISMFLCQQESINFMLQQFDGQNMAIGDAEDDLIKGLIAFTISICLDRYGMADHQRDMLRGFDRKKLAIYISKLAESEFFIDAAKEARPTNRRYPMFLDHHFAKFFHGLKDTLLNSLVPNGNTNILADSVAEDEPTLQEYNYLKSVWEKQTEQLASAALKLTIFLETCTCKARTSAQIEEVKNAIMGRQIQQLDELASAKPASSAEVSTSVTATLPSATGSAGPSNKQMKARKQCPKSLSSGRHQEQEEAKCVICLANKATVLFEPCCHVVVCQQCAKQIFNNKTTSTTTINGERSNGRIGGMAGPPTITTINNNIVQIAGECCPVCRQKIAKHYIVREPFLQTCLICDQKQANIFFSRCQHVAVCFCCSKRTQFCPICARLVGNENVRRRIFLS